jgi:N-acyl homoserine lactone hydrolase
MKAGLLAVMLCIVSVVLLGTATAATGANRLYVLYCGETRIPDISAWSPSVNVGQPFIFSNNCFLIHHGHDWMLWDSGYADAITDAPQGVAGAVNSRGYRTRTLVSQLNEVGVSADEVTYLAFSHTHNDHVGNANLFANATLYIQQAEYEAAFGPDPARYGFNPEYYDRLRHSKVVKLHGDYDVFGDGSVRILSTPGHTPGHQSLLVRLPKAGAIVLSGDAAHFEDNFVHRRVPVFNFNVEQSRSSMDRIAAILKSEHAQLWINHDLKQSETLLHAPLYYE